MLFQPCYLPFCPPNSPVSLGYISVFVPPNHWTFDKLSLINYNGTCALLILLRLEDMEIWVVCSPLYAIFHMKSEILIWFQNFLHNLIFNSSIISTFFLFRICFLPFSPYPNYLDSPWRPVLVFLYGPVTFSSPHGPILLSNTIKLTIRERYRV